MGTRARGLSSRVTIRFGYWVNCGARVGKGPAKGAQGGQRVPKRQPNGAKRIPNRDVHFSFAFKIRRNIQQVKGLSNCILPFQSGCYPTQVPGALGGVPGARSPPLAQVRTSLKFETKSAPQWRINSPSSGQEVTSLASNGG